MCCIVVELKWGLMIQCVAVDDMLLQYVLMEPNAAVVMQGCGIHGEKGSRL